ncbi:hypothetical protein ACJMK2_013010 [Sinanodonta woodiana]|uniref:G-protein coupled receptors family 1 profile domain-containing protein n=1 Tax=Sinanodonta woodiana TaxID=1069815 RepID=A0ABD3VA19_SINWO
MESMETNVNMSEGGNKDFQLERLEKEKVLQNIGGIILVSFVMIVGIGGNSIAFFVYLRKFKKSTHRTFIVTLAIIDLLICCVSMPFILVTLRNPITFQSNGGCKVVNFLSYFMCIGSSIILLTIAAERYRKICVPHGRQISERMSIYICVLDVTLGILFSWPAAVIFGDRTFKTNVDNIVGTECSVIDDFVGTKYPAYFNIFLMLFFFATLIILSILYALIGKQIFRMKNIISKTNPSILSESDFVPKTQIAKLSCLQPNQKDNKSGRGLVENICDYKSENSEISLGENGQETKSAASKSKCSEFKEQNTSTNDSAKKPNRTVDITRVLFIITVVYFCSFLPHLALRTVAFLNKNFLPNLSFAGNVAYQTFRWTFYINSMANPIIYGFYDSKFVREVRMLRRSCLARCLKYNQRRYGDAS